MRNRFAMVSSSVATAMALAASPSVAGVDGGEPDGLWTTSDLPTNEAADFDPNPVELGVRFETDKPIDVVGIRFYQHYAGDYQATLWNSQGLALESAEDTTEGSGWQTALFDEPVAVDPGLIATASYASPGRYPYDYGYFDTARTVGPVTALAGTNGVFMYPFGFPEDTFRSTNYWVTPLWTPRYSTTGFHPPVEAGGDAVNVVRGGSTVPLKFEVFWGESEVTDPSVVGSLTVKQVSCTNSSALESNELVFATTGGTGLQYDVDGGYFVQNWKTPRTPGSCYQVTISTQDGTDPVANFILR